MISSILAPIVVLGVLIIFHEFGHFIVAKACNVGVVKFSIGFGPSIFRFRKGETQYQLSLIPLGGYVRMVGDMPDMITGDQASDKEVRGEDEKEDKVEEEISEEELAMLADRSRWFVEKKLSQRSAIVVAGPLFNFLLAILLISVSVFVYGEDKFIEEPVFGTVMEGSPAEKAGLLVGDTVVSLDGAPIEKWEVLAKTIRDGTGAVIDLEILREGEKLYFNVLPQSKEVETFAGKKSVYLIGIGPTFERLEAGFFRAVKIGAVSTYSMTKQICFGLWKMLEGVVSPKELAGPIWIIKEASNQADRGLEHLLLFMAILSISLAVLNLLPIPVLDGGHLLFFLIEAIRGPISVRKQELAQQFGMLLLLTLMVFAVQNDIFREEKEPGKAVNWDDSSSDEQSKENTK